MGRRFASPDTAVPGHLGSVLVLGLGKSGKSVARYCAALLGTRVSSLFIAAGARNDESAAFVESLAGPGVEYEFGDDALLKLGEGGRRFDLCVASPGIPYWHDLYRGGQELSDEVVSEVEFSWRESAPDSVWVAVTGTNGKTTTTSCCAHVLRECGFDAAAVGNIGDVCLDAVAAGETRVYVAEVSSYQLFSTRSFAPDVAVMLNITPDHVHWHKTFEAYAQAKFKLLDNMGAAAHRVAEEDAARAHVPSEAAEAPAPCSGEAAAELGSCAASDSPRSRSAFAASQLQTLRSGHARVRRPVAILDATNDVVRAKVRELRQMDDAQRGFAYIPLGTAEGLQGDMRARCGAENAAFLNGEGRLEVCFAGAEHDILAADELQVKGLHNASNALAAAAVAVALGAADADIAAALRSFAPLEHRIEPCGSVAGVACYNDSKATNVDATLKALEAFPGKRVVVMLGGDDKGTDLADLVAAAHARASAAVCYGEGGPRFAQAFADAAADAPAGFECLRANLLEDAFDAALGHARAGDVVLLSPACASFDEFRSFEHRGRAFKDLVARRASERGA